MNKEELDRGTHIHYCVCGASIEFTGADSGGIVDCACGREYVVEQINGIATIFER